MLKSYHREEKKTTTWTKEGYISLCQISSNQNLQLQYPKINDQLDYYNNVHILGANWITPIMYIFEVHMTNKIYIYIYIFFFFGKSK